MRPDQPRRYASQLLERLLQNEAENIAKCKRGDEAPAYSEAWVGGIPTKVRAEDRSLDYRVANEATEIARAYVEDWPVIVLVLSLPDPLHKGRAVLYARMAFAGARS